MSKPGKKKRFPAFHLPSRRKSTAEPDEPVKSEFGEAQNVKEMWSLSEQDAYVVQHGRGRVPGFLFPLIVFVVLVSLLFWFLPRMAAEYAARTNDSPLQEEAPNRIYKSSTRVVRISAAHIWTEDDIKSVRITQALFNEPVTLLDMDCAEGFIHIMTEDGVDGYMKSSDVTDELDSVEPNIHKHKLIVSDVSKNVKSHASNGTLLVEVMMNTVLYSDFEGVGVYQVALPDGGTGWIGSSGVIELGVNDPVDLVGVRYFVSSVLSFVNMTHLDHGLTKNGLSVEGLAYISASVNGVSIPRTMNEQMDSGKPVEILYDEVTGVLDVESILPGDLVFFKKQHSTSDTSSYEMGICTDTGMLIMTSRSRTTLRLVILTDNEKLADRIIAVRRIF